jgi:hypothetical protein
MRSPQRKITDECALCEPGPKRAIACIQAQIIRTFGILVISVIVSLCAPGTAQTSPTARVIIKVADPSGAGIACAHVRVVPSPDPPPAAMETDNKGVLLLNLKVGGHGVFVSAQGFKSSIEHIEVRPAAEALVIPVELRIGDTGNPVVISEEEAADRERELFLSAMPYHADWWINPVEFKAMPHISVTVSNPVTGKKESYSGVRLSDLLILAGAPMGREFYGLALRTYVSADDVVFSLGELEPGIQRGEVVIADAKDGHPLDSSEGPFMLVVSADAPRARWVKHLRSITMHP